MNSSFQSLRKEYLNNRLNEQDIDPDPMLQFVCWMKEAVDYPVSEPNAMVLSTATRSGWCSSRVVLLKGTENGYFTFFTNYESRKGQELQSNPHASLLFFWKEMERQVRIEGSITKTTKAVSREYFNSRPPESRVSAIISPQSHIIPDRTFLEKRREKYLGQQEGKDIACPSYWGGFKLKPVTMEFWQGRENRLHDRIRYRKVKGLWIHERLAP